MTNSERFEIPATFNDRTGAKLLGPRRPALRAGFLLNLATRDLDASIAFDRTLLLAQPAKRYPDYALFLTEDLGLERALDADPAATHRQ